MAKYDLLFEQIKAHLINADNVDDTGTWPVWITAIEDAGNGNWIVTTADNGIFEVQDEQYIAITTSGTPPTQISPAVLAANYSAAIAEE